MKYLNGKTEEELMEEAREFISKIDIYDADANKHWAEYKSCLTAFAKYGLIITVPMSITLAATAIFMKKNALAMGASIWAVWFAVVMYFVKSFVFDNSYQQMLEDEDKSDYAKELRRYLKVIEMSEALLNDPEFKQIEHLLPKYDIESFDGLYDRKAVKNTLISMNKKYKEAQAIKNSGALTAKVDLVSGLTDLSEFRDIFVNYVNGMLEEKDNVYNTPAITTYEKLDEGYQYKKTLKI